VTVPGYHNESVPARGCEFVTHLGTFCYTKRLLERTTALFPTQNRSVSEGV